MGQWSKLPENLLHELDTRLALYVDKVRIRAICVSWNSLLPKMPNHKERQFLWLLHALENSIEASHALFNPIDKKFYQLDLPEAQGKLFKGSSHGWVVTAEDKHSNNLSDIYLINPLTRARIKLPSRSSFPDVRNYRPDKRDQEYGLFIADNGSYLFYGSYLVNVSYTEKIVLSSAPSSNDCIAVAIYGNGSRLTYCKRNDKKWRRLALSGTRDSHFVDMIFRKGKLHALKFTGELVMFESIGTSTTSKVTIIAGELPRFRDLPYLKYLFEASDGSLIMVARYFNLLRRDDKGVPPIPCTNGFKVFKLDSNNSIWVEVKNIGGDMLFLGLSSSFSVSSHHFPEYKGNHIYFTDSHYSNYGDVNEQKEADIGVFNIEDATIQSLTGLKCHPKYFWPPPVWVNIS